MCRALLVLCVAPSREALVALKRSAVGAVWELTPGATSAEEALEQLREHHPHVMVTFGSFAALAEQAREIRPGIRVVSVGPLPGADAEVVSLEDVRQAIVGLPPAAGPVRS
jgi:hypothetical protein